MSITWFCNVSWSGKVLSRGETESRVEGDFVLLLQLLVSQNAFQNKKNLKDKNRKLPFF